MRKLSAKFADRNSRNGAIGSDSVLRSASGRLGTKGILANNFMLQERKCVVCGASFTFTNQTKGKIYCSVQCRKAMWNLPSFHGINTGTIGAIGELLASAELMRKGFEVFRALSPASTCDLLGIKDGRWANLKPYGKTESKSRVRWSAWFGI